jgi:MFS family permease
MTPGRIARVALAATLTIQVYVSFAAAAAAVLAPEIAREFGLPTRLVGVFVGLVYAGAMFASLASGTFIERHGSIRVSQACVVFCAIGVLAMAATPAFVAPALAAAAIVIGIGYGPITPASSQLLQRTASPSKLALTFSIKQTGVPAGVAVAGAVLPAIALAIGWRQAFAVVAVAGAVVVALAQPIRPTLDSESGPRRVFTLAGIFAPLALLRRPALLELALVSLAYSAIQVVLTSFLVAHLTETLHWNLVAAGFALTAATLGGVAGRVGWGYVADRMLAPRRVLMLIGCLAGACGIGMALADATWPSAAIVTLAALYGATAIGWNGVQLSEVARLSEPGTAGKVTGAASFVTFSGVVAGPPSFALLTLLTGSYRLGFAAFAPISIVAALALLRRQAPEAR